MNIDRYRDENPPRREELPSGAVLLTQPMVGVHSVALGVWLRTGSEDEQQELSGLAHFLEHIVFKGTQTRSALEIATALDSLGVAIDAFTTKDNVAFTIKVLPEYLEPACEVLADMLLCPAFAPHLVALEQDVVCEEIQEAFDTPEERLHDAFAARVYGRHPRGRPILGSQESVRAFACDLLRREHHRLFSGPNLVIALAGNLQGGARETVLKHFTMPSSSEPSSSDTLAASTNSPEAESLATNGRLEMHSGVVQSYFEIGNLGISYRREGLAYTVYTYNDMGSDIGLVSCAGACTPDKAARVEEVIRNEYELLVSEGVSEEELENNRAQIKSQLIFSLEGVQNQMYRIAKNELYFGRFITVSELVDQIDSVDQDVIARCARSYFAPEQLVVATHGPAVAD
jgi:predicted Zn-dependent peptidase